MSSEAAAYFPEPLASASEREGLVCSEIQLFPSIDSKEQLRSETAKPLEGFVTQIAEVPDEQLLEQVSRGGREALSVLFRRHAQSVRNVAQRILRDEAETDDLLQDVFQFIFRKAALFDPLKGSARSWIFLAAYHRAFNRRQYLSTRHFYDVMELDEQILGPASCAAEVPFHDPAVYGILGKELMDKFSALLSPNQRQTIELFFFEGYTLKEIAEHTPQSLGNVRSYYYRGLERLRGLRSAPKSAIRVTESVQNGSSAGAPMPSSHSHEEFIELGALSTSGSLTAEEGARLCEHLLGCPSCREIKRQYESVVQQTLPAFAAVFCDEIGR
jgi:RNA polymerase sigma-70 factor, ECF subfamily